MKLRHALSVTALLTGSGLAAAQDAPVPASTPIRTVVAVQPSRPATLMDQIKARQETHATTVATGGTPMVVGDPCCNGLVDGSAVAPTHRFWFKGEYLLWRMSGTLQDSGKNTFPAFRNTMPWTSDFQNRVTLAAVPQARPFTDPNIVALLPGIDQSTTIIGMAQLAPRLFSGNNLESKDRSGARLTAGMWLNDDIGVEVSYFQLETRNASFTALATSDSVFRTGLTNFNVDVDAGPPPTITVTATPQTVVGTFDAAITGTTMNRLWGGELNVRKRGYAMGTTQFDAIFGFRYLNYDEALNLEQALFVSGKLPPADASAEVLGGTTVLFSSMAARNRFYGFQVGGQFDTQIWDFSVGGRAKIAVGGNNQTYRFVETVGSDITAIPASVYPNQDIRESRTRLDWVPELSAWVAYDVTSFCRLSVGYDVIFINRIMRPNGNPVSSYGNGSVTNLGTNQAVFGPAISNFVENRLFVYGLSFGAEIRF